MKLQVWSQFWMKFSGPRRFGRLATFLAALPVRPYYARIKLANGFARGYISYRACLSHSELVMGNHVYIDDGVLIYKDYRGGKVELGDGVHIHRDTILQTGQDGTVVIGQETHVQARCQFSAYKGPIVVGKRVEIAPYCAFYPYDHGAAPGVPIRDQPLQSRGGIIVDDEAWLGVNVIVLDGVRIGKGAVIGAGAVVTKDVPDGCIATGVPARVVKERASATEQPILKD